RIRIPPPAARAPEERSAASAARQARVRLRRLLEAPATQSAAVRAGSAEQARVHWQVPRARSAVLPGQAPARPREPGEAEQEPRQPERAVQEEPVTLVRAESGS